MSVAGGTSFMPRRMSHSLRSSLISMPARSYYASVKQRLGEDWAMMRTPGIFCCSHLHWPGVIATLLSGGTFPSFSNPMLLIKPCKGAGKN